MARPKAKPESIKDVIKGIFEGQTAKKGLTTQEKIVQFWADVVGRAIAKHTRPILLKDGKLFINVEGSGWLYGMSLEKDALIEKLNKKLGREYIKDIRLRIGEVK